MDGWTETYDKALDRARQRGLTGVKLAEEIGAHPVTISAARKRPAKIGWPLLVRLCEAAGIVGELRRELLYAHIMAAAESRPSDRAWMLALQEVVRERPEPEREKVRDIIIDTWSAVQADEERARERRKSKR